ncbi:unnamed protein product [Lota lota]
MEGETTKLLINDSRCIFFNTDSDDYRCVVILTVKRATGTFSLVGCFFMLFVIWLLRRYHSLAQKMILSLTVAAFFDSAAYVMGESQPEGFLCAFQGLWLTYFDWCALAWVCLITFNLYLNLVREISTSRYETLYHVTAWGLPLVMAVLPLLKGCYGPAGAWCWITDNHVAWRFGIGLRGCMCLSLSECVCVCRGRGVSGVVKWSEGKSKREMKVSLAEEIKPLKWYPSVYLLVSLFPLINRLHNAFHPMDPSFTLTLLHVLTAPLHGLANAFIFGLDRDTWGLLSPTGIQLALRSRLCDSTRIGEYHPGAVRYTQADLMEDDEDQDANVLFYSPHMTLKDRTP